MPKHRKWSARSVASKKGHCEQRGETKTRVRAEGSLRPTSRHFGLSPDRSRQNVSGGDAPPASHFFEPRALLIVCTTVRRESAFH